jgi:Protein of unknown function (DUF3107)
VDVRIGVVRTPKEIDIELADDVDRDELAQSIEAQLSDGRMLWLTDRKGHRYGVPAASVAYIEIGADEGRRVGFSGPA